MFAKEVGYCLEPDEFRVQLRCHFLGLINLQYFTVIYMTAVCCNIYVCVLDLQLFAETS